MNNVEELTIYKQFLELIYYTEQITIKYPKVEKYSLVSNLKNIPYEGMELVIMIYKEYNKQVKIKLLNDLDMKLKMLKVLIRVSHKRKYINGKNYYAWSKKIFNIGNLTGGWILGVKNNKDVLL